MKILEKPIGSLIPYEFNNKIHTSKQIDHIANSIKEFGFTQPIVIDKNNVVIIGHGRLEGAKKLGMEKVPVVVMEDLTENQIKKLRILDNKLNESERNIDNLKIELDELGDLNIGDIELNTDDLFSDIGDLLNDNEEGELKKEKKEMTEEQNELFNEAYREFLEEVLENQKLLLVKGIFDSNITKSASVVNFLKSLFLGEKYYRYNNLAYHPHILEVKGAQFSLNEGIERIVEGKVKVRGMRFTMGDKAEASNIYKCFLPVAGARMPADFPVELAKEIYEKYGNKGKVLDMCHGRGGRVVGFMLSDCEEYVGYDPSPKTYEGVKEIIKRFNKYVNKKVRTENECFEDSKEKEGYFDLGFTSPPYFNVEKYEGENQSRRKNSNFDEWVKNFYEPLISNTYRYLKKGGYMILQVGNQTYPLGDKAKEITKKVGFSYEGEFFSGITNTFTGTEENDGEMCYVFKK